MPRHDDPADACQFSSTAGPPDEVPAKLKASLADLKQAQVQLCIHLAPTNIQPAVCNTPNLHAPPIFRCIDGNSRQITLCESEQSQSPRHPPCLPAQVKCVSFLTWLMRVYPAAIITHRAAVTDALVHLLRTAPDVVSIRKELLVAMRHTLSLAQVRECASWPRLPSEPLCCALPGHLSWWLQVVVGNKHDPSCRRGS